MVFLLSTRTEVRRIHAKGTLSLPEHLFLGEGWFDQIGLYVQDNTEPCPKDHDMIPKSSRNTPELTKATNAEVAVREMHTNRPEAPVC